MSHPMMFIDNDPLLARVRAIAFRFPEAAEKISHGRPTFFTKKIFTYFGASVRVDGNWTSHDQAIVVLLESEEHRAAVQDERFFVPAYLGPSRWLGIDLNSKTDWDEIAELMESSYRRTAPTKLVAQLDRASKNR